ncbi:MAG TPA: MFS transporter [Ramlibacter sp.]|uniref:MFS transporter n=1 Tax=Ramlibacter sp. TaxID=1917967 RepID=UPI002B64769C|nr:MFS transporter [Ramlibacter sp.]HVZ44429.1 MFS transporter [Ramlibacter sp.]
MSVGYVFVHSCMAGVRMTAPLLALRQGHSAASVGVLMALFALTQVFLALPAGRFADRHGFKRPMMLAMMAAVAGTSAAVMWPIFPVLCCTALATGGAVGVASIALQRHVGRIAQTPSQLRQAFSWMSIGPAIANFAGPFLAGFTIDHAGFRSAFLLMALMPLATWLWIGPMHEVPPVTHPHGTKRGRAWDLWRETSFRRLLLVNWLIAACWDVHTFMVPVLGNERGFSASVIGTILGSFAVAAALIRVALPIVASRVHEWTLVGTVMIATAVLFAIYPLLPAATAMAVCSVLLGFALGSVQPMVMSMLHQITPEHRHGDAVAMRLMVINASSVAMPMLSGAAGAVAGVSAVFWLAGAVVGGGSRLAFALRDAFAGNAVSTAAPTATPGAARDVTDDRTSG